MPELPEVETMRRGVMGVRGGRIEDVQWPRCKLKPITVAPRKPTFRRRATGRQIEEIDRLGKRVLLRLDNDDVIVIEPRMTGLVLISDPPNQEHLRIRFRISGAKNDNLLFWDRRGLGVVRLLSPRKMNELLGPDRLGPDALSISAEEMRLRLKNSRREIKVALLDQKVVAGIGNLYAAEILHLARVHPRHRCNRMTIAQWQRVQAATAEVLNLAIKHEGSTLSDGTYRNALNKEGGYQNHHRVYDRAGKVCPSCGKGEIERIVQSQRSTFFCRGCQRK